ncbi:MULTISPECIES: hypothetical protein [unclassified Leptolyngbya]|uniref:hypothetical protein n=1 Tax=unclassified Leptolyngbya TaxID=2650499 RepID=UPI001687D0B7|nr:MULTISPECIES: hypothetical protein [unclassified Leptolyngbya]MBD1913820.1 hypothetical protein [Leptolyngbya sp. FACHB-8]MBD2156541.1 hypothetical protein [Leptolyngbya sp. FACHB-16]
MLKQDGISTILTAPAQGASRGMKGASQQVRQYDITPPPVAIYMGNVWRQLKLAFTFKSPGAAPIPAVVAPPAARALTPDFFQRFPRCCGLNFFASVSILNPSCRLG